MRQVKYIPGDKLLCYGTLITVTGYNATDGSYSTITHDGIEGSATEKDLQGIPLTEEVFRKNGWRRDRKGVCCNADNTVCIGPNQLKNMKYVHQLQHILFAFDLPTELLLP